MSIKELYKDYFQKSRIFLYPMLDIKRGGSVTPIQTYLAWSGNYTIKDRMFILTYTLRNDPEFKYFEKTKLLGNRYFHDFKQLDNEEGVYVFNMNDRKSDWDAIINGRYSRLSEAHKLKILNFVGKTHSHYKRIESFIYPEKYFGLYAELMGVNQTLLEEVGELCSKIDVDKETLVAEVLNLDIKVQLT